MNLLCTVRGVSAVPRLMEAGRTNLGGSAVQFDTVGAIPRTDSPVDCNRISCCVVSNLDADGLETGYTEEV